MPKINLPILVIQDLHPHSIMIIEMFENMFAIFKGQDIHPTEHHQNLKI